MKIRNRLTSAAPWVLALAVLGSAPGHGSGTVTYEWTALDTLEKAVTPEGTVEYTYDGDGQRISKSVGGESILYIRDTAGNVMAEYDEAGNLLVEYVYVGSHRIARASGANTHHFYHGDPVGTSLVMTDENGLEAWRGENLPFGQEVRSSSERDDKRKFTGKELDAETGLHYFGARYYSAELGRFISVDPVGGSPHNPKTFNRYSYALNHPLGFIDPDGRTALAVGPTMVARWQSQAAKNRLFVSELSRVPFVGRPLALVADLILPTELSGFVPGPSDFVMPLSIGSRAAGKGLQSARKAIQDATRLSPAEQSTAARLQEKLGIKLKESAHVGAEFVDDLGRSYDALGDPATSQFFDEKKFFRSIERHLHKSNDFTVIDLTGFTADQIRTVANHVDGLAANLQEKIIRIGF